MSPRFRILLYLLSVLPVQAYSQESGRPEAGEIAEAETEYLFINMLEFLGEFETDEGDWVSPDILGKEDFADLDYRSGGDGKVVEPAPRRQKVLSLPEGKDEEKAGQ